MKKLYLIYIGIIMLPYLSFSQGLNNNGANIIIASGAHIYIDGGSSGGFINQSTGIVDSDGSISLEGDWTNNASTSVFTNLNANGTTAFVGTTAQTIGGSHSTSFENFTINNSAGATLSQNQSIDRQLTLTNGVISTSSSDILTLTSNASVSGGSNASHVDGPMTKEGTSDFVFPTGDGGKWARIGVSNIESGTNSITAEYYKSAYSNVSNLTSPLTKVSQNEYWAVSTNPSGTQNADITLYWEDTNWSGIGSASDLRVAQWQGASWENRSGNSGGSGVATGSISSTSNPIVARAFTFGTIDNVTNPLPVELLSFDLEVVDNRYVDLYWQTASEHNNKGFEIQRSPKGEQWETIGFVDGAGNSNALLHYTLRDNQPFMENYYRLKQWDFDGSYSYSKILFGRLINEGEVVLYPNPSQQKIYLSGIEQSELQSCYIFDVRGRIVQIYEQASLSMDISHLAKGLYYLQLNYTNGKCENKAFEKM